MEEIGNSDEDSIDLRIPNRRRNGVGSSHVTAKQFDRLSDPFVRLLDSPSYFGLRIGPGKLTKSQAAIAEADNGTTRWSFRREPVRQSASQCGSSSLLPARGAYGVTVWDRLLVFGLLPSVVEK